MKCNRPLTVDAIIFHQGNVLVIRRKNEPFKGMPALPGGFVEADETTEEAVKRETREETGLETEIVRLIGVYSDPGRDPRGPVVSICYLLKATGGSLLASSDASDVELYFPDDGREMAFDHGRMIKDAMSILNLTEKSRTVDDFDKLPR